MLKISGFVTTFLHSKASCLYKILALQDFWIHVSAKFVGNVAKVAQGLEKLVKQEEN